MYTEETAKTKWCPHVQVSVSTGIDGTEADDNRNSTKHEFDRQPVCIGSACMAWRWNEAKRTKAFVEAVQKRIKEKSVKDKPYPHNKAIADVYAEIGAELVHTEGFCGLSGAPS